MTILLWRKRRYRLGGYSWMSTETPPELRSRQLVTARLRDRLFDRCRDAAAHAGVARDAHARRYQVQRAYLQGGDQLLRWREARPPRRLSLDEAHHRPSQELATTVSGLDRRRGVEVLDGRRRRVMERYLRSLTDAVRQAIEVVSIDLYDAYRQAIHDALSHAWVVVAQFHLIYKHVTGPTPNSACTVSWSRSITPTSDRFPRSPKGCASGSPRCWPTARSRPPNG